MTVIDTTRPYPMLVSGGTENKNLGTSGSPDTSKGSFHNNVAICGIFSTTLRQELMGHIQQFLDSERSFQVSIRAGFPGKSPNILV